MATNLKGSKFSIRKFTLKNWFIIAGSIIIFVSWIVEKQFLQSRQDEKERIKRSQLVINITENHRAINELGYFEYQKEKNDSLIAIYQQRLAIDYLNLIIWSIGRNGNDEDKFNKWIDYREKVVEHISNSLNQEDYITINAQFLAVIQHFKKEYVDLDNEFTDKVEMVNSNVRMGTSIFMILYIMGSAFLGLGYIFGILNESEK